MLRSIKNIFGPNYERYDGVYKINIYLLRLLYLLMFVLVGRDSWTTILAHEGPWNPVEAAAWSVWASYSLLSVIGLIYPLKMLPIVLLEILYKVLWLMLVAYPLWSTNQLIGSPAEPMTSAFLFVLLPIVATPWSYVFRNYLPGVTSGRRSPARMARS